MRLALVLLLCLTTPTLADPAPTEAVTGTHWETKGRPGVFIGGLALTTLGYFAASAYALAILDESRSYPTDASTYVLFVPVIGPAISQLMFSSCSKCGGSLFGNGDPIRVLLTLASSALQIPGLVMTLTGALDRSPTLVNDKVTVSLEPGAAGAVVGMTLVLRN